jgi:hypothetical protein
MLLIHETEDILRAAGYRTARSTRLSDSLVFEDDAVLGFVSQFDSVEDIVASWRAHQDAFITEYSTQLRRDNNKAWNLCAVFLTEALPQEHEWSLLAIETDVHASRKMARAGVLSRADLIRAVAPLLPLTLQATSEPFDVDAHLLAKLNPAERRLFAQMRLRDTDDLAIANSLVSEVA